MDQGAQPNERRLAEAHGERAQERDPANSETVGEDQHGQKDDRQARPER